MLSLPQAFTSGLPALKSPRGLPDRTTTPNGELRRQDFHLQVQQLVSLRSLQWVPWDVGSPPSSVLCSAKIANGPPRGRSVLPLLPRSLGVAPLALCPLVSQGSCERRAALLRLICPQGDPWLSQVPESPLWKHAPLSDPGGVLYTRRIASKTAAFRSLHTVGFCLDPAEAILLTTTLHISGLYPTACFLVPSSFVRPLLGVHVEFAPDLLARR
jgi:hypothetical protein